MANGMSKNMQCLIGGLRDLHGVVLENLLTSPTEQQARERYLQELSVRHSKNMELVASLETEVAAVTKDRDAAVRHV